MGETLHAHWLQTAINMLLIALLLTAAWMGLSGHTPRVRTKTPFSLGRFMFFTLRLNSLHDWLLMNLVNARNIAERMAAASR